jgi:glycosyltransferase involved in cell wall biosynthesis
MRVLFAIAHLDKGGGQAVQCAQLVRRLAPRVDGELLLLRSGSVDDGAPTVENSRVVGDLRFPQGMMQLRRAIRDRGREYDLVQALDPYYSLPAARLSGVHPLAVRLGGHPVEDLASRYGFAGRSAMGLLNPWLYSDTRVVVNAPHLVDALGRPGVRCIPNGVDVGRFPATRAPAAARADLRLPAGVPIVAFTGKIIPRKNIEDLYWLTATLPGVHLALAGTDREPYYGDSYHRRVRAEFPTAVPRVHSVGEIGVDRIPRFLEAADVFVFPSRLEGMPNSVLEAMAAGLPVVAADTPAHRAILPPHASLVYRDREELRAHVAGLLADPDRAAEMGRAARAWVIDRFGFDAAVESYLRLYAEMLAS